MELGPMEVVQLAGEPLESGDCQFCHAEPGRERAATGQGVSICGKCYVAMILKRLAGN